MFCILIGSLSEYLEPSDSWTLDKSNPFRFEKAVIPDEPERISERLKPLFSGETGV